MYILIFISFMFIYAMRVHLYRSSFIIFFSQIPFIWLITSVSYCHLDLLVAFFVDLAIHFLYLRHFIILAFFIVLVTTLFVVSHYLIKDILLMLSSIIIIT
jgi:hypothetical protein